MVNIIERLILSDIILFASCFIVASLVEKHSQAERISHLVGGMSVLMFPILLLAFIWI
jgi:hypothetical protein